MSRSGQQCRRCLYTSDHPFGLEFDRSGLCTGCLTYEEKFHLNWDHRFALLETWANRLRVEADGAGYHCVVPVRGTPEHFYVVDIIRNRLGLVPLLVNYNSQFNSRVGLRNLHRIREVFDVDFIQYTSDPRIYRKLVRESLARIGSVRWPYLAGERAFAVRSAVERNIPAVVWPYHQPTEQVGMHSYRETPEMTRRDWVAYDLMGVSVEDLLFSETTATKRDLWDLRYPTNRQLLKGGVKGIYLANFLPWDSRAYSEAMVHKSGAVSARNSRTFDPFDRIDDVSYMGIHDALKFARLGYSRVTDNLCREIRFGRVGREDALAIERHYQADCPHEQVDAFLSWLGMSHKAFRWYLERSPFGQSTIDCWSHEASDLSRDQADFVNSFVVTSDADLRDDELHLLGKGIDLSEEVPERSPHGMSAEKEGVRLL